MVIRGSYDGTGNQIVTQMAYDRSGLPVTMVREAEYFRDWDFNSAEENAGFLVTRSDTESGSSPVRLNFDVGWPDPTRRKSVGWWPTNSEAIPLDARWFSLAWREEGMGRDRNPQGRRVVRQWIGRPDQAFFRITGQAEWSLLPLGAWEAAETASGADRSAAYMMRRWGTSAWPVGPWTSGRTLEGYGGGQGVLGGLGSSTSPGASPKHGHPGRSDISR